MKTTITIAYLAIIISLIASCNAPKQKEETKVKTLKEIIRQDQPQSNITGIYEFQINRTTIKDLDTLKYKSKEITVKDAIENNIKRFGTAGVTDWFLLCDGVRQFKIKNFSKGSINFSSITLTFQNDTLINFNSAKVNWDLLEALQAKYPKFKEEVKGNELTCDWFNEDIEARWYTDTDMTYFAVRDFNKMGKLRLKGEDAKKEYIKKMNSAI